MAEIEGASEEAFTWPSGVRAAVSMTFDDGRASQLELGLPILDEHGIKATFYVLPRCFDGAGAAAWRGVAEAGHEIGNHTVRHPCSGNYGFARPQALESYTLEQMGAELDDAQRIIAERVGVTPTSFAYPCGQRFVGRGESVQSYVPVVARRFGFARAWRDESANDPAFCDFAQLFGVDFDRLTVDELRPWVETAVEQGHWLVLGGHDVAASPRRQAVLAETLAWVCELGGRDAGVWVDTLSNVGQYVREQRGEVVAA
ncbi:MAG: polysaccharide deacetylase family protein [Phycisphaeraceae bacterium]